MGVYSLANKKIVIVGTGFAAVYAAKKLARHFKKHSGIDLIIISQSSDLASFATLRGIATDRLLVGKSGYDLQNIFHAGKNVQIVTDQLLSVDFANKKIITSNGPFSYDFLILSADDASEKEPVPGISQAAFRLTNTDQALSLRNNVQTSIHLGAVATDLEKRRSLLSISVIGAGYKGLQIMADLINWRDRLALENKIDPTEIQLSLIDKQKDPLDRFPEKLKQKINAYLKDNQVRLLSNAEVVSAGPGYVDLFDGKKLFASTVIWSADDPNNWLNGIFGLQSSNAGHISIKPTGQSLADPAIYVIGSHISINDQGDNQEPLSLAGDDIAIKQSVKTVAKNVASAIKHKDKLQLMKDKSVQKTLSLKKKLTIATTKSGKQISGLHARWIQKRNVLAFFLHIGSFYYQWQWLTKKAVNRNILQGTRRAVWGLAARLFLALIWLVAGLSLVAQTQPALADHLPTFVLGDFLLRTNFDSGLHAVVTILIFTISVSLFLGFFTWLSALFSILLLVFLVLNHAFIWSYIWVFPMTLAIMNGSGRILGLDKYWLPWLGKTYYRLRYGRPKLLYRDENIK